MDTHKAIAKDRFDVVYNAFDNFEGYSSNIVSGGISLERKYTVGYIGSFYFDPSIESMRNKHWWHRKGVKKLFYFSSQEQWIYRSPFFFFQALSKFLEKHPSFKNAVSFAHIGNTPDWLYDMAERFGLRECIISHGFVDRNKLATSVREFDAFLTTSEKISGDRSFCLPSKTFDYLKYGKPFISFVKKGDFLDFLKGANMGIIIDPDNLTNDFHLLEKFLLNRTEFRPDMDYIESYHAKVQTAKLANIIKSNIVEKG
jgi:hypothetical protein